MLGMARHTKTDPAREAAEQRLADIIEALQVDPGAPITRMRALSSEGYAAAGHLFAFIGTDARLVVKLPAMRVDDHEASGTGSRMQMGERLMKQWAAIPTDVDQEVWAGAVAEAYLFVTAQGSAGDS